jgi:hypothetical protein
LKVEKERKGKKRKRKEKKKEKKQKEGFNAPTRSGRAPSPGCAKDTEKTKRSKSMWSDIAATLLTSLRRGGKKGAETSSRYLRNRTAGARLESTQRRIRASKELSNS